jgi:hypothetical protein
MLPNSPSLEQILQITEEMSSLVIDIKNSALSSYILYKLGILLLGYKVSFPHNKCPKEALSCLKNCRRVKNIEPILLLKCYKAIGKCILQLKSEMALHYFTKYLWVENYVLFRGPGPTTASNTNSWPTIRLEFTTTTRENYSPLSSTTRRW